MIRTLAIAAAATLGLVLPAGGQIRGDIAIYGQTVAMACYPNTAGQTGNIIVYGVASGQIPAGTTVTITYNAPFVVSGFFGLTTSVGFQQITTTYRTRHTMGPSDPEVTGLRGNCVSATYEQPLVRAR